MNRATYNLNAVYYTPKAEIRVTVEPKLRDAIQPFSILEMERAAPGSGLDYVCRVYPPGSQQYNALFPSLNQGMPSGGRAQPRRFGWL